MKRNALLLFALAAALLAATPARALDPTTADAQAREARASGAYTFCSHPPEPLPMRARQLCGVAREIPDCEGLVKACEGKKEEPSKIELGWLGDVLKAIANVGIWILVALVIAALAIPILQAALRARRDRKLADPLPAAAKEKLEEPPIDELITTTDAERLLRQAEELAGQGKLDRALYVFLQAALRALDERGAIRIERHRTHGEYVRGCKEPGAKKPLRELVRAVDRVKFGGERPDGANLARARELASGLVRLLPVALLALVLAGCGNVQRYAMGADPSEDGLLLDLLSRQGAHVGRLGQSLATVKPPQPGEIPAVLVVDVEHVPLEDETRAHLVGFVEKGGVLVLAGAPQKWPKELGAKPAPGKSRVVRVRQTFNERYDDTDEPLAVTDDATIARASTLVWPDAEDGYVARFDDGKLYAALWRHGAGRVLGVANDDLFTNAGLARPGNARALVRMLANLHRNSFQVARPEDGITPPSNPLSSLVEAGLGKGLLHAAGAVLLLFLAIGIRHARARPTPPPARRAFAEHVEATGALYARTRIAAHALRAYAKYADGRLRAQMPRGASDPAAHLAARAKADPGTCARLWARATDAARGVPPRGDEIVVLKELSALVSAATAVSVVS